MMLENVLLLLSVKSYMFCEKNSDNMNSCKMHGSLYS